MNSKCYNPGLLKTILWTKLHSSIKSDYGIELPKQCGQQTNEVLNEIIIEIIKRWIEIPD